MAIAVVAAAHEICKAVSEMAEPLKGVVILAGFVLTFAPEVLSGDQVLVPAVFVAEILTRISVSKSNL